MDLGFLGGFEFLGSKYSKHPFSIVWANEINAAAVATYRANIGDHITEGDVWQSMDQLPTRADVVIGGFPCQDISINGKGGGLSGKRSSLYSAMVSVVAKLKPRVFVAENVKGLLMKHHSSALKKVVHDFASLGYEVSYQLYNSAEYGVPQTRERVFIVGTLPGKRRFSPPTPVLNKLDLLTASDAIEDLADLPENGVANHVWSKAEVSGEQGNRKLDPNRPGYTIRAECHGNIQWHYKKRRRISMREAARIQSFPDEFIFQAKLRETERQIGNAVPPVLAWHIAKAVSKVLA